MNNDIVILENQVVIMEGILNGFWDSMTGKYTADPDYIKELKERIVFTKARIRNMA